MRLVKMAAMVLGMVQLPLMAFSTEPGHLYNSTITVNSEMEWLTPVEVMEISVAKGVAGGMVSPLDDLGNFDSGAHYDALGISFSNIMESSDYADETLFDNAMSIVPATAAGGAMEGVLGVMDNIRSNVYSMTVDGPWAVDPGSVFDETRMLTIPVQMISESLGNFFPLNENPLPMEAITFDFSDGWRRQLYDLIGLAALGSFVIVVTTKMLGIVKWIF